MNNAAITQAIMDAEARQIFGLKLAVCGFHGHPATYSINIRPLIPR